MGEIAEMMLDGTLDEWTGEYLGPGPGFPRSRDPQHPSNMRDFFNLFPVQNNPRVGVEKWLSKKGCKDLGGVVRRYQDEVLHLEGIPKHKTICKHISSDFPAFTKWFNSQTK